MSKPTVGDIFEFVSLIVIIMIFAGAITVIEHYLKLSHHIP